MLHLATYLLFKLNLVEPSARTIRFWMYTDDIEKLEYALKHGNYKTRLLAAEELGVTGYTSFIPVLFEAVKIRFKTYRLLL